MPLENETDAFGGAFDFDAPTGLDIDGNVDPWSHPQLRSAYRFWRKEASAAGPPLVSSIDPLKLPRPVFPHIAWGEYVDPPGRVRFRLAGQQVVDRWGRSFRGRTTAELLSGDEQCWLESCFAAAYRERRPILSEIAYRWPVLREARAQLLLLPFVAASSDEVSSVLMIEAWTRCKSSLGQRRCTDAGLEIASRELRYCYRL